MSTSFRYVALGLISSVLISGAQISADQATATTAVGAPRRAWGNRWTRRSPPSSPTDGRRNCGDAWLRRLCRTPRSTAAGSKYPLPSDLIVTTAITSRHANATTTRFSRAQSRDVTAKPASRSSAMPWRDGPWSTARVHRATRYEFRFASRHRSRPGVVPARGRAAGAALHRSGRRRRAQHAGFERLRGSDGPLHPRRQESPPAARRRSSPNWSAPSTTPTSRSRTRASSTATA